MDFGIVLRVLGLLLLIESASMLPSFGVALYYHQGDSKALLFSMVTTLVSGLLLYFAGRYSKKRGTVRHKEGFLSWGWVGSWHRSLVLFLSTCLEAYPAMQTLFEAVSGFTTTGATILTDVEAIPKGLLFWRSFTHWLGGMGILVFQLSCQRWGSSFLIFKAETTGPTTDKLTRGSVRLQKCCMWFILSLLWHKSSPCG